MATQNNNRQLVTKEQLQQEVVLARPQIEKMLPKHLTYDKFEGTVINVVSGNSKLLECSQPSLLRAVINAADVGLSLNPVMREADILPVWSPNGTVAQFRPRAIGMMKLARQSGEVIKIAAHEVYDDDFFEYEYGMDEKLVHKPCRDPKPDRKITHGYCVWQLKDGSKQFEVIDRARIDRSRAASEGWKYAVKENKTNSVWHLHEGEMVRKTAVRAASKYMPQSTENDAFLRALEMDRDDENVIDGSFTVPGDDPAAQEAQTPQSGATQTKALEAKLGVAGGAGPTMGEPSATAQNAGGASPNTPGPAAPPAQTEEETVSDGGVTKTTTTRTRARNKPADPLKPAPQAAASEPEGPLGPEPPPPGEEAPAAAAGPGQVAPKAGSPMQDLPGDDIHANPNVGPVDWAASARAMKAEFTEITDLTVWKNWLNNRKPQRDRMKAEAPEWHGRLMKAIVSHEEFLRSL